MMYRANDSKTDHQSRLMQYSLDKNISKFFHLALFAFSVLVLTGCDSNASNSKIIETLKSAQEKMEAASAEFVSALKEVVDESSAIATKPKLEAISEKMVAAGNDLELAMSTKSRLAVGIKKEVSDFRREQKILVDEQVRRIKRDPKAESVLEDMLKKISSR